SLTSVVDVNLQDTTPISTLSLHDALPILLEHPDFSHTGLFIGLGGNRFDLGAGQTIGPDGRRLSFLDLRFSKAVGSRHGLATARSEEHTSELQSRENLVCRLLLEKKKKSI